MPDDLGLKSMENDNDSLEDSFTTLIISLTIGSSNLSYNEKLFFYFNLI